MAKGFKISSGIIGVIVGIIIGWYLSRIFLKIIELISENYLIQSTNLVYGLFMGIGAFIFLYLDIKKPILVESIGFIFSTFVFLQFFFWDLPAGDINSFRIIMFFVAIILFIINIFTGHLKIKSGIKYFKRSVGSK